MQFCFYIQVPPAAPRPELGGGSAVLEIQVLTRIERTSNPLKCNPKFGHWVHTKTTHFIPKTTQIILENGYIIHGGDIIQNIPILYQSMLSSYCSPPKTHPLLPFPLFPFPQHVFCFCRHHSECETNRQWNAQSHRFC